jgi:hypothetical protein
MHGCQELAREEQLRRRRQEAAVRRHRLEPRRAIRQLDVAWDSILTAAKLTLALLLTFALREYMPGSHMTPQTFISRVFGLRGRRTRRPGEEHIVFDENPRDPAVNQSLAEACRHLNQRALVRQGRRHQGLALSRVGCPRRPPHRHPVRHGGRHPAVPPPEGGKAMA